MEAVMIGIIRGFVALAAVALSAYPAHAAEQVDLLLVLASDVSRSIDHPKFLLQREGYAAAVSDPQVIDAVKSGPHQRIANARPLQPLPYHSRLLTRSPAFTFDDATDSVGTS